MGVLVSDNDTSRVNCFTCGFKSRSLVPLVNVLIDNGYDVPEDVIEGIKGIEDLDLDSLLTHCNGYRSRSGSARQYITFPESEWRMYEGMWHSYLDSRGLSYHACKSWRLGFDEREERVVVPVISVYGEFVGAVGRKVSVMTDSPKYKNYWPARSKERTTPFDKSKFLIGEHRLAEDSVSRAIIVEGFIDAMYVSQFVDSSWAVLSTMGAMLSQQQCDKIVDHCDEAILMLDNDQAGIDGAKHASRSLGRRIRLSRVDWSGYDVGYDPATLSVDQLSDLLARTKLC